MGDNSKARRLQKILGNSNGNLSQVGPSKRRQCEWNILRRSETIASVDLDKFDLCGANQRPNPALGLQLSQLAIPKDPAISTKECIICRDSAVEFSRAPPTERCVHRPEACVSCIAQTIKTAVVVHSALGHIHCPHINCGKALEHNDIRRGLGSDTTTWERYNELLLQQLLEQDEGYVACLDTRCGAGQIHAGQNIFPIVTCYKCGAKTCYQHRVKWHEGYTCIEWENCIWRSGLPPPPLFLPNDEPLEVAPARPPRWQFWRRGDDVIPLD